MIVTRGLGGHTMVTEGLGGWGGWLAQLLAPVYRFRVFPRLLFFRVRS